MFFKTKKIVDNISNMLDGIWNDILSAKNNTTVLVNSLGDVVRTLKEDSTKLKKTAEQAVMTGVIYREDITNIRNELTRLQVELNTFKELHEMQNDLLTNYLPPAELVKYSELKSTRLMQMYKKLYGSYSTAKEATISGDKEIEIVKTERGKPFNFEAPEGSSSNIVKEEPRDGSGPGLNMSEDNPEGGNDETI